MTALIEPLIPEDEAQRLAAVRRYEILDTPPDGAFDRITAVAATLLRTPIAIVSVVDTDRIWFKSHHGLDGVSQIDRAPGLCASAILHSEPWIVTDAAADPRTLTNPLVAGDFGLRFYAGVPLTTSDGYNLGTLCVIDFEPRAITEAEMQTLSDLASLVMDQLELRLVARRTVERAEALREEAEGLADALQATLLPPRQPSLPGMEIATRYLAGQVGLQVGGDFFDVFRIASNDWGIVLGDACGKGARPATLAALARWTIRASAVHEFSPSDVLRDLNAVFNADNEQDADDHFCSALFGRLQLDTCGAWLTIANAGHPLPVLVRRSGKVELRGEPALPVGLFDDINPIDHRVGLGPGDALVLFTDGITEARNAAGEPFGEERLIEELRALTGAPVDTIADRVISAARDFSGFRLTDDVAVVVVRVPDNASEDPLGRVSAATRTPIDQLELPGYPHENGSPNTH